MPATTLAALGVDKVVFSGGEPVLHPALDRILGHYAAHVAERVVITNGLLIDGDMRSRLLAAGATAFTFSIDSVDPGRFEANLVLLGHVRGRWRCDGRLSMAARPRQCSQDLAEAGADDLLAEKLDALAADMEIHGPLRHRVDGRQLVADVEQALVPTHGSSLPKGGLLSALDRDAHQRPPAALLADLRSVLEKVPPGWRSVDA